jgi:hypothetical protein
MSDLINDINNRLISIKEEELVQEILNEEEYALEIELDYELELLIKG